MLGGIKYYYRSGMLLINSADRHEKDVTMKT